MAQPWMPYIMLWVPPGTPRSPPVSLTNMTYIRDAARSASNKYALFSSCTRQSAWRSNVPQNALTANFCKIATGEEQPMTDMPHRLTATSNRRAPYVDQNTKSAGLQVNVNCHGCDQAGMSATDGQDRITKWLHCWFKKWGLCL